MVYQARNRKIFSMRTKSFENYKLDFKAEKVKIVPVEEVL
jgi:hypothetical protein